MRKVISLFTGVGGLDFGFEAAGFDTTVAVDIDRVACETVRLNRRWAVLQGDIHDIRSADILRAGGLRAREADVLIGGPPCQPFSKSSYWLTGDAPRMTDPRAETLATYLRVLRDTLPKVFVCENVLGLAYKGKDEGLQFLLDGIAEINRKCGASYTVSVAALNAADFGVPQIRHRVFLVGHRGGRKFSFPKPTHAAEKLGGSHLYRTAWDALADLPDDAFDPGLAMTGKWAGLLPTIPEGHNYLWHTSRGGGIPLFGWRTRYWSFLLKLAKRQPSWTIQAQPGSAIGPFHWKNRRLTARELCRLQTLPDGLYFKCGRTDVQRMLGNAVPSLLGEVLAREISAQLFDDPLAGKLRLLPPRRRSTPPPEKVRPVPDTYSHLAGEHPDHPGEGRGASVARPNARQHTRSVKRIPRS